MCGWHNCIDRRWDVLKDVINNYLIPLAPSASEALRVEAVNGYERLDEILIERGSVDAMVQKQSCRSLFVYSGLGSPREQTA